MDRPVDAERTHAGIGWIEAPAGEHRAHGKEHGRGGRQAAVQPRADAGEIGGAGILEIGPLLQVARIFRGLAVDEPRVGR